MKTNYPNNNWLWITGLICISVGGVYLYRQKKKAIVAPVKKKPLQQSVIHQHTAPKNTPQPSPSPVVSVQEPDWRSPFDMRYASDVAKWVVPKKVRQLSTEKAKGLAAQLYEAKGKWYQDDDEQAVYNVFGQILLDKVQVANLSATFYKEYKTDMWQYLKGFLSSSEMERYVHVPVRALPNYRLQ